MLSIIVYGRNDNHGYNLHKRAAISLNALAEVLDQPGDEIIFVDYNTPDDHPSFLEAIQDTLTDKARAVLRVLRLRPEQHRQLTTPGALRVVEPLSRNIALRRSNPLNRWVLNTNTDIILHLRRESLEELLTGLPDGFYQAPRIELPETLWESFDRKDAPSILAAVAQAAPALHLDEIVYGLDAVIFDGCGDFQLATREALFAIDGFDERMDRGWHVDSNMAVRMGLYYGQIQSLEQQVFAYHCDHTRQATSLHKAGHVGNDAAVFVDQVATADLPHQRDTWGANGVAIEELRLDGAAAQAYAANLTNVIGAPQAQPLTAGYRPDSYGVSDYDPRHTLPFLLDLVYSADRGMQLGWAGYKLDMLRLFADAWQAAGFTRPIALLEGTSMEHPAVEPVSREAWIKRNEIFVFDFGDPQPGKPLAKSQVAALAGALGALRNAETERRSVGLQPRRIAGIACVHNRYEKAFGSVVGVTLTPFSTRIRSGFARPVSEVVDWRMIAELGLASLTANCSGLRSGSHLLRLRLEPEDTAAPVRALVEIDGAAAALWVGSGAEAAEGLTLPFAVSAGSSSVTVRIEGLAGGLDAVKDLWSAPPGVDYDGSEVHAQMLGRGRNWLPYARIGSAGEAAGDGIRSVPGRRGHVIFGPYWLLPPGKYSCQLSLDGGETRWAKALREVRAPIFAEVVAGSGAVVRRKYVMPSTQPQTIRFDFAVEAWQIGMPIEIRVFSAGASAFTITAVNVEAAGKA